MNVDPYRRPADTHPPGCGLVAVYEQPVDSDPDSELRALLHLPPVTLMPRESLTVLVPVGARFTQVFHWTAPWWSPWRALNTLRRLTTGGQAT